MVSFRALLSWALLAAAIAIPMAVAAASPLLAWRDAIYIASGFAGIAALALMLVQPLLAGGYLPGLPAQPGRRAHRWIGAGLFLLVAGHVAGLFLTSAPDVIDALLFESPTPFSAFGVVAMWAIFTTALLAMLRRPLRIRPRTWRVVHTALALLIVSGSVAHALLVEGTMGTLSKAMLCLLVLAATAKVVLDLRTWTLLARRRG
jgi:predicted ferric reductase